jgi:hypothetical protein
MKPSAWDQNTKVDTKNEPNFTFSLEEVFPLMMHFLCWSPEKNSIYHRKN